MLEGSKSGPYAYSSNPVWMACCRAGALRRGQASVRWAVSLLVLSPTCETPSLAHGVCQHSVLTS